MDFVNGADANNGLGPDASDSTNKPWKTIAKLLGASGMASGDTAYLSPAGPFRESVTVAMTSPTAETKVLGDPANAQGFKTSGGVRVAPGEVILTEWTTSDTSAASATTVVNLAGRDYLTFQNISFLTSSARALQMATQTSTNITIRDCAFLNHYNNPSIDVDGAFGTALTLLIERCLFAQLRPSVDSMNILFLNDTGSGSDYDLDVTIRNCLFLHGGGYAIQIAPSGGQAQKPGGIDIYNCTMLGLGSNWAINANSASISTTYPIRLYNSVVWGAGLLANTTGQIVEDYNHISSLTTHSNVTQGGNTVTTLYAPNFHVGQERLVGANPRMFFEPKAGSWALTFGNNGTYTTSEDFLQLPRPGGGASATKGIGYLGRGNTFAKETGTVRTGSNAISITGPGTQDFQLPVDATSTTVTCYVRWDATYAGTKPQMKVLNCEEAGVTAASTTATGSSGAWEQLSLNFTPTRAGIVTIRLQSNDTNGGGKMFADDFAVA